MTPTEKFIEAMHDEGIGPHSHDDIRSDDQRRRYRVHGDKPGTLNGEYVLRVDADGFGVGFARSYKSGGYLSWHTKSGRKATAEEKREWQERREADKKRKAAEDARIKERGRTDSQALWADAESAATHPYAERKQVPLDRVKVWMDIDRFEECIVIPAYKGGEIVAAQKIYPDGDKLFVAGSDMQGSWFGIGDVATAETVAVCEGWATGESIHAATGWAVAVAFNAGNMVSVTKSVREIAAGNVVICSDEDIWTFSNGKRPEGADDVSKDDPRWPEWREAGLTSNRGRDVGMAAAGAIGGAQVLYPEEGGDWNDVAVSDGVEAVGDRLKGLLRPIVPESGDWVPEYSDDEVGPSWEDAANPRDLLKDLVGPLGYDKDIYYFLPRTKGQIIALTATALGSAQNLFQLGSLSDYARVIGQHDLKASDLVTQISPQLMDICHKMDTYEPNKVFGAGAWKIGKTVYVNTGRSVYNSGDGKEYGHREVNIDGAFVKDGRAYDLNCDPLSNKDANKLIQICQMPSWKRPISGTLLAGWLVVAPVGGALRWRPHIFLTGPKGAGKSTIVEMVVEQVLGDAALRQDGGSTEAGLRLAVGDSSRPVIMDEFEGENKRDADEVGRILFWARKGSSGGVIVKANGRFKAQSCVCFAAINPLVSQGADADRITLLELMVNNGEGAEEQYSKLLDMIHETLTPEYANRMVRRTVDNIDALLHNCEVFSKHASRILKSKRDGDQFGPMLAGAYMLHATGKVTDAKAEEYCARQDWSWVYDQKEGTDSERLIRRILNSMIEYTLLDRTVRMPVSELISRVLRGENDAGDAAKSLARHGMVVKDGWLCVANTDDGLSGLLRDTPWTVYRSSLARLDGVTTDGKTMRFGTGSPRRYLKVPLAGLLDDVVDDDVDEEDGPF